MSASIPSIPYTQVMALFGGQGSIMRYQEMASGNFRRPYVLFIDDGRYVGMSSLEEEAHQTKYRMEKLGLTHYNVPLESHLKTVNEYRGTKTNLVCVTTKGNTVPAYYSFNDTGTKL